MQVMVKGLELQEGKDKDVFVEGYASAAVKDLDGEIITEEALKRAAEELKSEVYNKVFLHHDVRNIPVGKVVEAEVREGRLWVKIKLNKAHPDFEPVYRSLREGFLDAFSIGFKVLRRSGNKITRLKILEVSLVGVPANPEATVEEVYEKGITEDEMLTKGISPGHPWKYGKDADKPWSKPSLGDFTSKSWEELSESEKRSIAGHFAWAPSNPPERFSDLKLPHHFPGNHAVSRRGVVAAMAALFGARGGVDIPSEDRRKVYNHLAKHYREFDMEPPEFKAFEEIAGEFLEDLKSPSSEAEEKGEDSMSEEVAKLEARIKELEQEKAQLEERLKAYEEAEKRRLIDKAIAAEKKLYGAKVDEGKRREELAQKSITEIKEEYLSILEKLSEQKQIAAKVEVPIEDGEFIETKWGKANKQKLEELRKAVGLEVS